MHFSTLSLLALPLTLTASSPLIPRQDQAGVATEYISFPDAIFSQSDAGLTRIGFIIKSGDHSFQCAQDYPQDMSARPYPCDDPAYSWRLLNEGPYGWGPYKMTIYHQTGVAVGLEGNVTIGCNGPMPKLCEMTGYHNTTLCSDLTVCGDLANN